MRSIQEKLSTNDVLHSVDQDQPPAVALKEKRLTFTWLDGEAQQVSASSCMSVSLLQFSYALQFSLRVKWIRECDGL